MCGNGRNGGYKCDFGIGFVFCKFDGCLDVGCLTRLFAIFVLLGVLSYFWGPELEDEKVWV